MAAKTRNKGAQTKRRKQRRKRMKRSLLVYWPNITLMWLQIKAATEKQKDVAKDMPRIYSLHR